MSKAQSGILLPVPAHGRSLGWRLRPDVDADRVLQCLSALRLESGTVVGLGQPLLLLLGAVIEGMRAFPALSGVGVAVPSTQDDLWVWLRGQDPGELVVQTRKVQAQLDDCFGLDAVVGCFRYDIGRDLTGYVDGTENPKGEAAAEAALADGPAGLADGSFVAVQQWAHDLDGFEAMSGKARDHVFGRTRKDDRELDDAPASAHVKRTAQEGFEPPAFVLRRSMPWAEGDGEGLLFIAYGRSLYAYEAQLRRMLGLDDGVVDALFRFSRPVSGAYYWCPPVDGKGLDLRAVEATG
jgi:porphyrinogen peroxidase